MIGQDIDWTQFKAISISRGADMHYIERDNAYAVFLSDGPVRLRTVIIKDGTMPSEQTDFENNYKPTANATILGQKAMVDSQPVVLSSNHPPIGITGSISNTVFGITGSISNSVFGITGVIQNSVFGITGLVGITGSIQNTVFGVTGPVTISAFTAVSTASVTNVGASTSVVTLLASNANRKGVLVVNEGGVNMRIKYGSSASASDLSVKIAVNGYWEMPQPIYTGILTAIWDILASGSARVTEL